MSLKLLGNKRYKFSKLETIDLLSMEEANVELSSPSDTHSTSFATFEECGGRKDLEKGTSLTASTDDVDGAGDFISIGGPDATALALEKCEKYVLRPYKVVLKILGWMAFTLYGDTHIRRLLGFLRAGLISFWVMVIIITSFTQILSCFRRDSFLPGRMNTNSSERVIRCEEHVISAYILTDFLLVASYLFGVYLFSREEIEYLSNLASKVFIKCQSASQDSASNHLVWTILIYFICGLIWIFLSLCVRILTTFSVDLWDNSTIIAWGDNFEIRGSGKIVLIILDLIGFVFFDMVYVAAVMNYAAQSEMNIYLLHAVKKLIQDKGYGNSELDGSIKDIIECRKYLRVLNGKTATATALILFNLGSAGLVALISLNLISEKRDARNSDAAVVLATLTAGFNVILWIGLVSFPFIQASRVTEACLHVKATGPEMRARPQLYASTPQLQLDSYVTLTQAVKLRATMFGVPVYPWMWWAVFTGVSFTALILFQTGTYSFTVYL